MKSRNTTSHRPERIASVIKRAVAVILEDEISDPRISGVSVLDVTMSHDLRNATVWVSVEDNEEEVMTALRNCSGYVRRLLSVYISEMRAIPQLHFDIDRSQSYYEHIENIIKGLHNDGNGDENT